MCICGTTTCTYVEPLHVHTWNYYMSVCGTTTWVYVEPLHERMGNRYMFCKDCGGGGGAYMHSLVHDC